MKKLSLLLVALLVAAVPAHAKEDKAASNFSSKKQSQPSVSAATPAPAQKSASREEMKKKVGEKKKELNGSEWEVALTTGGKEAGKDTLTFQNGQIASKMLADKGYPASNYTISVPEGADMATWETMQTHPKAGVVFIRGEWKEGVMRGVISEQIEEGKTKDYNFSSAAKTAIPPTTEKPKEEVKAEETPAAPAQETVNPMQEETSDKKEAPAEGVTPFAPGTTEERR